MKKTGLDSRVQLTCACNRFALAGGWAATFSSLIGGGLATSVDYAWVFWIIAIAAIPSSILVFCLSPVYLDTTLSSYRGLSARQKMARVDLVGALLLALFLILFVFSLTEGNRLGWLRVRVLVPLAVGTAVVLPTFLVWEEFGRTRRGLEAALPLSIWKMKNFSLLFIATGASFYWYGAATSRTPPSGLSYTPVSGSRCTRLTQLMLLLQTIHGSKLSFSCQLDWLPCFRLDLRPSWPASSECKLLSLRSELKSPAEIGRPRQ